MSLGFIGFHSGLNLFPPLQHTHPCTQNTRTHTRTHARAHAHTHAHTHTHTHTHSFLSISTVWMCLWPPSSGAQPHRSSGAIGFNGWRRALGAGCGLADVYLITDRELRWQVPGHGHFVCPSIPLPHARGALPRAELAAIGYSGCYFCQMES